MFLGPRGGKQFKTYAQLGAVGIELGLSTVVGLLAGQWADRKLGTEPWLLVFGLLIGVASGFRSLIREALKAQAQARKSPPSRDSDNDNDAQ